MFRATENDSVYYLGGKIDIDTLSIKKELIYLHKNDDRMLVIYDKTYNCFVVSLNINEQYLITESFLKKNAEKLLFLEKQIIYCFHSFLFGVNPNKYVYYIRF